MSRLFTLAMTAAAILATVAVLPANYPVDDGHAYPNGFVGGGGSPGWMR